MTKEIYTDYKGSLLTESQFHGKDVSRREILQKEIEALEGLLNEIRDVLDTYKNNFIESKRGEPLTISDNVNITRYLNQVKKEYVRTYHNLKKAELLLQNLYLLDNRRS